MSPGLISNTGDNFSIMFEDCYGNTETCRKLYYSNYVVLKQVPSRFDTKRTIDTIIGIRCPRSICKELLPDIETGSH